MSKRTKFLLGIGVIAALVIGFQVAAFALHPEESLAGSNFEIDTDANLKLDDPAPSIDWASVNEIRAEDEPTGQDDDSYKGGVKEDTVCPAETTGSIPNNKSDLLTFHVYEEAGTGGHPGFLNLAWSRVTDPSGTTLMDFEFNQADVDDPADACPQGPNVQRTAGDLLLEYSIDQGGSRATITARTWTGSAWGPAEDISAPSADCPDANGDPAPCATGTINSSPIPAADSDGIITTGSLSPRTFGEAQLDLRLIFDEGSCDSFGAAMLKSRSSDSFTSQLKDFIAPVGIDLQNCGNVIIRKQTNPDEDPNSTDFGYTKDFNTDPTSANTFTLKDDGVQDYDDTVLFGTGYTVTEDVIPAGWEFVSLDCSASSTSTNYQVNGTTVTFDIDSDADVLDCTYTNQQLTTTLSTAQSFIPQDTATVGGSPNTGFDGTVDFRLYTGSTCDEGTTPGTLLYEELNVPLSGTTAGSTASTNNDGTESAAGALDGYTITGTGTFSWKVTYEGDTVDATATPPDTAAHPDQETCIEESTLTINNDNTPEPTS